MLSTFFGAVRDKTAEPALFFFYSEFPVCKNVPEGYETDHEAGNVSFNVEREITSVATC